MDWEAKAKEYADDARREGIAEGHAEGLAEGHEEGRLSIIINMMNVNKDKGKDYCAKFAKKIAQATDEEIRKAMLVVFK